MIRKILLLLMALALAVLPFGSIGVLAQDGPVIVSTSVTLKFPQQLIFQVEAVSDTNINEVRFHYQVERESFVDVTSESFLTFDPATEIELEWTLETVRIGGLAPGSTVHYWWTVKDTSGDTLVSAIKSVQFNDARYSWESITEGNITLYWYHGSDSFARELMDSADIALMRLKKDTGAELTKPIEIFIYASSSDLRGSMIYPQEWTGGVAYTRQGIIAIGISEGNLNWGKLAMTHELTHMVIAQVTFNPYSGLPIWLDEGLAMYSEGILTPDFVQYLNQAIENDTLLSVRNLASPFSADTNKSYLSYAQSYSLVSYLIQEYGQEKMLELLMTFRDGATYDGALLQVYGFNMDGLNERWLYSVTGGDVVSAMNIEPVLVN